MAALDEIPSWTNPPNFLAASEGGARAGLAARAEQREETGAADRLRLAYDQLARQEKQQSAALQARIQLGTAANALRAAHEQALLQHYSAIEENSKRQADAAVASAALKGHHYFHNADETVTHVSPTGKTEILGDPKEKPKPEGSLTVDSEGAITGARGAPGSKAIAQVQEKAKQKAAEALLPRRGMHIPFTKVPKLTRDQAKQFLDAAGGDKDKARQLAKDAGWEF